MSNRQDAFEAVLGELAHVLNAETPKLAELPFSLTHQTPRATRKGQTPSLFPDDPAHARFGERKESR